MEEWRYSFIRSSPRNWMQVVSFTSQPLYSAEKALGSHWIQIRWAPETVSADIRIHIYIYINVVSLCLINRVPRHELGTGWTWMVSFTPRPVLHPGKEHPAPIGYEARSAPEPVWTTLRSRENVLAPAGIRTPAAHLVARLYTDWATYTFLGL
jgi:hypothetical protein